MRAKSAPFTQAYLKGILSYNKHTGIFQWRKKISVKVIVGQQAGCVSQNLVRIGIHGKIYTAHTLAWFYVTGTWPLLIDHRDLNGINNRFKNLRCADKSTNGMNRGIQSNNTTGLKGVCKRKDGRFSAQICKNRRSIYLGLFRTAEDAHAAYMAALPKYHGVFARGNS